MMGDYWPAPAKINLFLHITGVKPNGYHELQTVFQFLDWCDYLTFDINKGGEITFECDDTALDNSENLVLKAATLLKQQAKVNQGVHIGLQKNLPSGAGLGGGSSDAATTLVALNHLWQCKLNKQTLQQMGAQLGADVPVFIFGKTCWAEGIGDEFSLLNSDDLPPEKNYYLLKPTQSINTASIFASPKLKRDCEVQQPENIDYSKLSNVFEELVADMYPEIINTIRQQYEALKEQGVDEKGHFLAVDFRMTGSGSVFFIAIKDDVSAKQIKTNLPKGYIAQVSRSQNDSMLNKFIKKLK